MKKINPVFSLLLWITILFIATMLAACATSPKFDTAGIDASVTPKRAVSEMPTLQGALVLWGGVIIVSNNHKDSTQIEILAYPLDSYQKPDREQEPLGRFLAVQAGYLETTDYAAGRLITVRGSLSDKRIGHVGEAEYIYPVVNKTQLHLWSGSSGSQVQFGFGLMIHN